MGFMLVTLLTLTAGIAAAGTATPRVSRREARQNARIQQGVASGQFTPREAARLYAEQRRVHRMKWLAKSDGVVTPAERFHLAHAQNHLSREIFGLKHNPRTI
jgi:hypothetical protein